MQIGDIKERKQIFKIVKIPQSYKSKFKFNDLKWRVLYHTSNITFCMIKNDIFQNIFRFDKHTEIELISENKKPLFWDEINKCWKVNK